MLRLAKHVETSERVVLDLEVTRLSFRGVERLEESIMFLQDEDRNDEDGDE